MGIVTMETPIGRLRIVSDGEALTEATLLTEIREAELCEADALTERAVHELSEYFAGKRQTFDLPLSPCGTPFQKRVWQVLLSVPYGETVSYGELAALVGCPNACRAVGGAVGKNPLLIFIPCHRVLGKGGRLGGFSAGLPAKRTLLAIEKISYSE